MNTKKIFLFVKQVDILTITNVTWMSLFKPQSSWLLIQFSEFTYLFKLIELYS